MEDKKFTIKIPQGVLKIPKESVIRNSLTISVLYEFIEDSEKQYNALMEKIKKEYDIDPLSKTIFEDIEKNKDKLTKDFFNDFFALNYLMGTIITISTLNDSINSLDVSNLDLEVIDGKEKETK